MDATTLIDSFRVDGKVAVVTGAGSGIGKASALALAGAGATVVCADIQRRDGEATADEIIAHGERPRGSPLDVSVRDRRRRPGRPGGRPSTVASTCGATSPASWSKGHSSMPPRRTSTGSWR